MQDKKDWFTISEAAKYLGVSPDTLRRWEKAGKISPPRRTAGGARRYSKELLEEILGGGRKEEKAQALKKKARSPIGRKSPLITIITLIITLAILLPILFFLLR